MPRKKNSQKKLHVKKGDEVMINKDITGYNFTEKGTTGRVIEVYPDKERVTVEGVNIRVFHEQPSPSNPDGGRVEREVPIHVSNVNPIDSDGNPTRIGRKQISDPETGQSRWVRYAKTTGEELDK
ncbi:50S ribosomal protein L24 [Longibacter salinarum]|uniref:Large ribosomal subunit protein uL24 n=1 Tax=Longibacter salinarum TaxID=1850348 RepID=A0A2A8D3A1_9BACT|nr:50S ribosomal protein L24 [Longibacter salinarum]PEN15360.1 50S ribosomal protein L24 [Longibacter salinarum]